MKTPKEIDRLELLAASYACDYRDSPNKTNGIPDSYLVYSIAYDAFLDGYKAAKAIVEEELQAVQAQRVDSPGLGAAEYALKSVLAKMGEL